MSVSIAYKYEEASTKEQRSTSHTAHVLLVLATADSHARATIGRITE
jgi:hypothetical protein